MLKIQTAHDEIRRIRFDNSLIHNLSLFAVCKTADHTELFAFLVDLKRVKSVNGYFEDGTYAQETTETKIEIILKLFATGLMLK